MSTATLSPPMPPPPVQTFVIDGVSWESYQAVTNALLDRNIRITYDRGRLEFMSKSYLHECLSRFFVQISPGDATIHTLIKRAGTGRSGTLTSGTEGPAAAPEIPHACVYRFRIARAHGHHRATGGCISTFQDLGPALAAIGGFVNAAIVAVAP